MGEGTKFAAEMWLEDIQAAGGLDVGGKKYQVELVIEDNESKAESAVAAATKLITQDAVLIMIGPQASKQAVPAGGKANELESPMISPWSTNPATTLDRRWIFRACFLDPFQGPVVANFFNEEFGLTKAGVLYDVSSDYPKGLAEFFKQAWETLHGAGSVVAYESFTTGDQDFSAQLTKIKDAGAEFLFTPQYYNEVALIAKQAHQLGFDKPIVGSDCWGSAELMNLCGDDCKGLFFSTHYAAAGAKGATKEFIDRYNQKHGSVSQKLMTDLRATKILLDSLTGLGLLKKSSNKYTNTSVSNRFLVKGKPYYQGDIIRHADYLWKRWSDLDEVVKTGRPSQRARNYEAFILGT